MKHIGFDVDSTTTHISVFNNSGREVRHTQVPTREADLVAFLMSITGPKQVALEESQMADFVTRIIEPHAAKVVRCLPQHNRLISRSEKKCDREDARNLAELLYLGKLKAVHHAPWGYRQLREGVRAYWRASRDLARSKIQLKAFCLFNGLHCTGEAVFSRRHRKRYEAWIEKKAGNKALLEQLYGGMDFCRARKAAHIKILRDLVKPFRQDERCLKTLPGVGFIGACTLIAYLQSGWRFGNKRRLWQYCGVGIRKHESAGTGHRGASRQGNRYLKTVLMTASVAISSDRRPDNHLALRWHREICRGVAPARARRNMARKVAVLAQRCLRFKEEYDDERVITTP
jgi:transposase